MQTALPKVLEQLEQAGGGLSDGQLLARFVAVRDEAAFTALLRRHGPMVLAVCRRVLPNHHDAEDAFQATFLILARKAATVQKRESLGCWLHTVAQHTALEAAQAACRRRARERQVRDVAQSVSEPPATTDWRPLLDRELGRLSEKYRAALVLCDLEGRPQREAARLLGVPTGTLSSRLTRARALLAKRLLARGVALSAGTLAALVATDAASAQVPAALVGSTVRVAALVAAGQLTAGTPAVLLMKGAMKAMLLHKLRAVVGGVMVVAALGAVGFACRPGDSIQAGPYVPPGAAPPARTAPATPPAAIVVLGDSFVPPTATAPAAPQNELEKLREENDYLKRNIRVLLDRIKTLEGQQGGATDPVIEPPTRPRKGPGATPPAIDPRLPRGPSPVAPVPEPGTPPPPPPVENILPPLPPQEGPGRNDNIAPAVNVNPGDYLGGGPRKRKESDAPAVNVNPGDYLGGGPRRGTDPEALTTPNRHALSNDAENALNAVREAKDLESRQKALDALEKAIKEMRKSSKAETAR